MTKEQHIRRHQDLHRSLDELLADFITHTEKLPSKTYITELLRWSHQQTIAPAEKEGENGGPEKA